MAATTRRGRASSIQQVKDALKRIETDPNHHIGALGAATPRGSSTPVERLSPPPTGYATAHAERKAKRASAGLLSDLRTGKWVINPLSSFKMLFIPIALYLLWSFIIPYVDPTLPNPFAHLLFISHPVEPANTVKCLALEGCPATDNVVRYRKGWLDVAFLAYYIVVWSFVRQAITIHVCQPLAHYFAVRKAKRDRFGEQGYAIIYFAFFGAWGYRIMGQLPTWWYNTKYFWIDYPHWDMLPELKTYYLVQAAYWCQQLIVMVLKLEKPRSDYNLLIVHHAVTLWLVGWSYIFNHTVIGSAVYMSMDIPDMLLSLSMVLNYMRWERAKIGSFVVLLCTWTYFREYLNAKILYSVWTEFDLIPESARRWAPKEGVWMPSWMRYQVFIPLLLLKCLNIFWYFLLWRIAYRAAFGSKLDDVRSDDEGDGDSGDKKEE